MIKKRHYKRKRIISIFILVILIICGIIFGYQTFSIKYKIINLGYSKEAAKLIIDKNLGDYILKDKIYSKTLEEALIEDRYEKKNLTTYVFFEYKNYDKYIYHLNELKKFGYQNDDINIIFDHLKPNDIDILIKRDTVVQNLTSYVIDEYFKVNNLNRYVQYKSKHQTYAYEKVINYVNMNLDYPFYEHVSDVKDPNDTLLLVNKYNKLDKNFVPKDLVSLPSNCTLNTDYKVRAIAKTAFSEMCSDMNSINLNIKSISNYRSYVTQQTLYNNYVKQDGIKEADNYSARPGYSEHQTGLALDVYNGAITYTSFDQTPEYAWLVNNAHKYGFIIRYPKNKEEITGYKYEPWHLRYVGEEVATYIHSHSITFDEYYAKFIEK